MQDRYIQLKEQRVQSEEGIESSEQPDERQLFLEAVGGENKKRIYGLGSQAFQFYPHCASTSNSNAARTQQTALQNEVNVLRETVAAQKVKLDEQDERMKSREEKMEEMQRQFEIMQNQMQQVMKKQLGNAKLLSRKK